MLYLAGELEYYKKERTEQLIMQCRHITGAINKLINYLDSRK